VFGKMGKRFGWEVKPGEAELAGIARSMVLERLALAGDEEYVKKAMELFKKDIEGTATLPKDLRSLVHKVVMKNGSDEQIEALMNRYRTTGIIDEKVSIARSVGYVSTDERAKKFIEWAMSSGELKTQDIVYVTNTMSAFHFDLMWKFLQEHWDYFYTTFKESAFIYSSTLGSIVRGASDYAFTDEMRKFFADKDVASATKALQHNYATVFIKSRWLKQCREENIVAWVKENC